MASKSNRVNPDPCGPEDVRDNFATIREQFEQVFPKLGCATENWRLNGGFYPSHPSYPSCPTLAQLCTVAVTYQGDSFTVLLPCPRSRDPNIENGDSVLFQLDFDENALYLGTHDDPIGTVKWFHGLPAEVPKGWYRITDSAPGSHKTRTLRWANGLNKYVKNYFELAAGTDPTFGTLGMHCPGVNSTVDVTVDPHDASDITIIVDDHPVTDTSLDVSNIGIDWELYTVADYAQVTGPIYVDHIHSAEPAIVIVNIPDVGTPTSLARHDLICTSRMLEQDCLTNHGGYADHDLEAYIPELTVDGYIIVQDPGHFHVVGPLSHTARASGVLPHTVNVDHTQKTQPRVYFLLIERLNNAANATGSLAAAGEFCEAASEP